MYILHFIANFNIIDFLTIVSPFKCPGICSLQVSNGRINVYKVFYLSTYADLPISNIFRPIIYPDYKDSIKLSQLFIFVNGMIDSFMTDPFIIFHFRSALSQTGTAFIVHNGIEYIFVVWLRSPYLVRIQLRPWFYGVCPLFIVFAVFCAIYLAEGPVFE